MKKRTQKAPVTKVASFASLFSSFDPTNTGTICITSAKRIMNMLDIDVDTIVASLSEDTYTATELEEIICGLLEGKGSTGIPTSTSVPALPKESDEQKERIVDIHEISRIMSTSLNKEETDKILHTVYKNRMSTSNSVNLDDLDRYVAKNCC